MKDPIKFTDIESQWVTIFLGIILAAMTIFLNSTFGLLWASIFATVGIVGIYLRAWRRSVSASKAAMNDSSPWIYFDRLMARWKLSETELHERILNTKLRGKRYVDYTDYASSQETPNIIPVEEIETEFDIIDKRLCFRREDIEEFEKKHGKAIFT